MAQKRSSATTQICRMDAVQHITSQEIHRWQASWPKRQTRSRSYKRCAGITSNATVMSAIAKLASRTLVGERMCRKRPTTTITSKLPKRAARTTSAESAVPSHRSPRDQGSRVARRFPGPPSYASSTLALLHTTAYRYCESYLRGAKRLPLAGSLPAGSRL